MEDPVGSLDRWGAPYVWVRCRARAVSALERSPNGCQEVQMRRHGASGFSRLLFRLAVPIVLLPGTVSGQGFWVEGGASQPMGRFGGYAEVGWINQITDDHSFVEALLASGHITKEQAAVHPMRNVLYRALGQVEDTEADLYSRTLNVGDWLVLCSDGLTRHVSPGEIADITSRYDSPEPVAQALIDLCGFLFLLLPVSGFIFFISWDYVAASWALKEGSREAGGLPGVFLLKSILLLMPALLLLQGLSHSIRALQLLTGSRPEKAQEGRSHDS